MHSCTQALIHTYTHALMQKRQLLAMSPDVKTDSSEHQSICTFTHRSRVSEVSDSSFSSSVFSSFSITGTTPATMGTISAVPSRHHVKNVSASSAPSLQTSAPTNIWAGLEVARERKGECRWYLLLTCSISASVGWPGPAVAPLAACGWNRCLRTEIKRAKESNDRSNESMRKMLSQSNNLSNLIF